MLTNPPVPYHDLCVGVPIQFHFLLWVNAFNQEKRPRRGLLRDCENYMDLCFQLYFTSVRLVCCGNENFQEPRLDKVNWTALSGNLSFSTKIDNKLQFCFHKSFSFVN